MHFSVDDLTEVHFVGYLYILDLINERKTERITDFSTVSFRTSHALTIVRSSTQAFGLTRGEA